jgi:hypothetical protein
LKIAEEAAFRRAASVFPDPPFLPGNSYRQKTRPGCCLEQELIAQRTLDDKSGPGGLLPREIPIFIGSL